MMASINMLLQGKINSMNGDPHHALIKKK